MGSGRHGGQSLRSCSRCVRGQESDSDVWWRSAHFLPFVQCGTLVRAKVLLTFRMTSNPFKPYRHTHACVLADFNLARLRVNINRHRVLSSNTFTLITRTSIFKSCGTQLSPHNDRCVETQPGPPPAPSFSSTQLRSDHCLSPFSTTVVNVPIKVM